MLLTGEVPLTSLQRKVLAAIRRHRKATGQGPKLREIAVAIGYRGPPEGLSSTLKRLVELKIITWVPRQLQTLRIVREVETLEQTTTSAPESDAQLAALEEEEDDAARDAELDGPPARAALEELARRLELELAGVRFALTRF